MKQFAAAAVLLSLLFLSACGDVDETHVPEGYFAEPSEIAEPTGISKQRAFSSEPSTAGVSSEAPRQSSDESSAPPVYSYTAENVPEIIPRLNTEGDRTKLELDNVYSEGQLFSVTASVGAGMTGELLALTLSQGEQRRDLFLVEIPRGDSFVFLENAEDNSTYGFEAHSNLREFDAPEYPDIIGFIFREENGEAAVPIYARYFAVFGGKLQELPVYENDKKVPPRGAKLEPKSAGKAVQHLTVLRSGGEGYEIIKFEYYFDLENRRLNKRQVKFYGWES